MLPCPKTRRALTGAHGPRLLIVPKVLAWGLRDTVQVRPCKLNDGLPLADGRFHPMRGLSQ